MLTLQQHEQLRNGSSKNVSAECGRQQNTLPALKERRQTERKAANPQKKGFEKQAQSGRETDLSPLLD
jgi:hypothetical protein